MNGLNLREVNEYVLRLTHHRLSLAKLAFGVEKLDSVEELAASIALVTLGVREVAEVALTKHEAIGQEAITSRAILLIHYLFVSVPAGLVLAEYILSNLGLPFGSSAAEVIKVAIEPVIDALVDLMVMVADLLWCLPLFKGLSFRSSAIFVSTTDVKSIVAHETTVPSKDVCAEHATDDVAEMRDVVNVW